MPTLSGTTKHLQKLCFILTVFVSCYSYSKQPVTAKPTTTQKTSFSVSKKKPARSTKTKFVLKDSSADEIEKLVKKQEVKSKILDQYSDWKGVRYRFGGTTKSGVDCSAFVQITFREQFGLKLPRTTSELHQTGRAISQNQLRSGDLVLFNINARTKHVGIYLGNNKFVHASTSKGVMISNLTDKYWAKRYKNARRVLDSNSLQGLV